MRRLPHAVLVLLTVVLATACGGEGGAEPDESPLAVRIREAGQTTEEQGSARVYTEVKVNTAGTEGKQAQKVTIAGEGVWSFSENEGRQVLSVANVQSESITKGGSLYTKNPNPEDPNRPWSRIPASGGARLGATDPEQAIKLLLGASEVERDGRETVREAETERFKFVIDGKAAAAQLPEGEAEAFEQQLQGRSKIPATIWIDGEGRMRRLRYSLLSDDAKAGSSIIATMELFDFGVDVVIEAPKESEIQLTN